MHAETKLLHTIGREKVVQLFREKKLEIQGIPKGMISVT